ncbi:ATP-grasp domain-containing protein [Litorivicinus sp.]|nr:ATP-grasp domain-containing protein [Litorivicinus sp.]
MNLLISGIAGDIGFGISKVAKTWGVFDQIHGIDTDQDHLANFLLDHCEQSPGAAEANYLEWLERYIELNKIDLFIPSSEAEMAVISKAGLERIGHSQILINSRHIVTTFLDKYETLRFLSSKSVSVPDHGILSDSKPNRYPVVLKPRFGQGSKEIYIATGKNQLPHNTDGYVWQEKLDPDYEEYTCAIYVSRDGIRQNLIIRRRLAGGFTSIGEVIEDAEIENYLLSIADAAELTGLINVQLRKTRDGPLLFEINPRLSSTLVFRDLLGFQDFRWWVSDTVGFPKLNYVRPLTGTKFYRGISEHVFRPGAS